MSKQVMLLFTAAMLVWSLSACGCTAKQAGQQDSNQTAGETTPGSTEHGNLAGEAGDAITEGLDDLSGAADQAGDALTGTAPETEAAPGGGVSYEQMLRNARVHDRDGILTDNENSFSRW